jgi:opacity protein-like surface antigen
MNLKSLFATLAGVAVMLQAGRAAATETTNDWSFEIVPYLWVASVKVDTTLPDAPVPPGESKFDTKITGGALCAAQLNYKSFGLWVDFDWIRTKTEPKEPGPAFSGGDLTANFYQSTAALTYKLPLDDKFQAKVLAGAQLWSVTEDLTLDAGALPGVSGSDSRTWINPVVGADLRYALGKNWTLLARGVVTVVGSGADSKGWDAMGGVSYRISNPCSIAFGYRYMHEEYTRERFNFNTDIQGFIIGFGIRF